MIARLRGRRALFSDELCRDIGEGGLEGVAVDDGAAEKIARASGNRGETLGEQAAGAAFRGGEREVAQAEIEENDLFERFAVRGEDGVVHLGFDLFGELVDAALGFGEGGFGAEEVELDLAWSRRGWWSRRRCIACRWARCGRRRATRG